MRRIFTFCVVLLSFFAFAASAKIADAGVMWASGATELSNTGVTNLRPVSRATGAPDTLRWRPSTTASGGTSTIRWTFPSAVPGNGFFVVLDQIVTGTITAQVVAHDSTSVTGTVVTLTTGVGTDDRWIPLPFNKGSSGTITTIDVKFTFTGVTHAYIDTFGTPEPATFVLFGVGLIGMGLWAGRRRRLKKA